MTRRIGGRWCDDKENTVGMDNELSARIPAQVALALSARAESFPDPEDEAEVPPAGRQPRDRSACLPAGEHGDTCSRHPLYDFLCWQEK